MTDIECLKNSETKKYIVPTNEWLEPLEPLITSLSTKGKIILSSMVKKQRVVVKITKGLDIQRIKNINYLLRRLPNFPKIYCVFECIEDESNFDSNYLDIHGFCSKNENDSNSDINIILEIMKLYTHRLVEYKNTLNLDEIKSILQQLIFALMYAFESSGFIHADLHIENILLNRTDYDKELIYKIDTHTYKLNAKFECIIMDFDKSITYNNQYMPTPDFIKEHTIIHSIKEIIQMCGHLYKKNKKYEEDPLNKILNKILEIPYYIISLQHGTSLLSSFYSESRTYEQFINLSILETIYFVNKFWKELFDEYLFTKYTVEYYSNKK